MKRVLHEILKNLVTAGSLTVRWPDGSTSHYGATQAPAASIRIWDSRTVRRLALDPGLAFGEAYMDGCLTAERGSTIYDLLDVLLTNLQAEPDMPVLEVWRRARRMLSTWRGRPPERVRRSTAQHYNITPDVYRLFLGEDLQYSCAYFPRGDETLEQAQEAKKRHIAAKLKLDRPNLSVLDIGCGWGGLALTLARDYGARVTGITVSEEQAGLAAERAAAAGLADRVRFRVCDYRDMDERFDRIVSVGMMEHVGVANYPAYFTIVRRCLKEDGAALIHLIGRSDGPGQTAAWLDKYIFPGGYSPALSELAPHFERAGLVLTDLEVLRLHYAKTIRLWRERFTAHRSEISALRDARFCRMFEFYLAAVELAFSRQRQVNFQMQFTRTIEALPLTRTYMMEDEKAPARAIRELLEAGY